MVVPEVVDMSLQPIARSGPSYDAAAITDRLMAMG